MKQTYDTDSILYVILKESTSITSVITGGVYPGSRPDNSIKEDVVVNTIALTQDSLPQIGTSNVNIHVADVTVTIDSVQQKVENRSRLKALTALVLDALRDATITGLAIVVETQTTIEEADVSQHYVNIRINWYIH